MATVFTNGTILVGDGTTTAALAVEAGRVVAHGPDAVALAGPRVDLDGGTLVPAFRDGHVHPLWGGVDLGRLPLDHCDDVDAVVTAVAAHAAAHPELDWIVGGPYRADVPPGGLADASWLDAVVSDRPVALSANDYHTMWVNSRALELAGITAATPDPLRGRIVRRADGSPMGTLVEFDAIAMIEAVQPHPTAEEMATGLVRGLGHLAGRGIAWAQEAAATAADGRVYLEGARAGALPIRVNLAWRIMPETWRADREELRRLRAEIAADPACRDRLTAHTVKFFADGVIEQGTGFLLEPYEGHDGHGDGAHDCGLPNWTPEALAEAAVAFDADGFQVHVHAIGDGGIRMALDAVEAAVRRNGRRDRRAVIAHTQLVDPSDRPRFAALGVVANFEPLWAQLDPTMTELTIPRLGPRRSDLQYPVASLAATGAAVSFGSDWPVSSADPLEGLAVAVTRQTPDGHPVGGWTPDERVPIEAALAAYSAGSAHQAFEEADRSDLAVGSVADATVLAVDPTSVEGAELADVEVTGLFLAGVEAWRR